MTAVLLSSEGFQHGRAHVTAGEAPPTRRGLSPRGIVLGALAGLLLLPAALQAQSWPSRPVTMVVPFAAGGPMDTVGRILAPRLSELLAHQVIIENVGGGGGTIGSARVAKAAARRLSVRARQCRHPRGQPDPVQESALQFRDRFRAGRADRRPVAGAGRAQGSAGRQLCRSSSPMRRPTRPRCSSARPARARRRISAACCSMRRSESM